MNRVLVDACALAPRTIRDWLLLARHLGSARLFRLLYTEDILAETVKAIRRRDPHLTGTDLTKVRDRIVDVMDSRIDEYGHGQDLEALRDVYDRHVHAAAAAAGIDILVTTDRHFLNLPEDVTTSLEYEIQHPDDFFLLIVDSAPTLMLEVLQFQSEFRRRRNAPDFDFAGALQRSGCPKFAHWVTQQAH